MHLFIIVSKKILGVLLIIIGLLALTTPFTPGSWLIFVGLEFMGIRILFWHKIKAWMKKAPREERSENK